MPIRTLQIQNGPSFETFVLVNGIVVKDGWHQTFTMDQEIPDGYTIHAEKTAFQMELKMLGRMTEVDPQTFTFIGHMSGATTVGRKNTLSVNHWFYVGTYNTRTRRGVCEEMKGKEFFRSPIMRQLFPGLARICQ